MLSHRWAKLLILFSSSALPASTSGSSSCSTFCTTRATSTSSAASSAFKLFQYLFTGVLPLAFFFYRLLRAQTLYDPELGSGYDPEMAEDVASWHFHAPAPPGNGWSGLR